MPTERRVATHYATELDGRWSEHELVDLAGFQHGVVGHEQLRLLRMSASGIRTRVARGRLYPIHRGVYSVGRPEISIHGRWMAATLACGANSVLSHRSAAALHELQGAAGARVDVTHPCPTSLSRPGIRVHRSASLTSADRSSVRGIPCTSVPRTLLDLAGVVSRQQLERACDQAEVRRILNMAGMNELLERARGRRGVRNLRAILGAQGVGEGLPRSELEERFLLLCRRAGIPLPSVNVWMTVGAEEMQLDFVWWDRRLAVETDGYRTHGTRQAFRRDRRRDQLLATSGWRFVRFTWDEVVAEPGHVVRVVRTLFAG